MNLSSALRREHDGEVHWGVRFIDPHQLERQLVGFYAGPNENVRFSGNYLRLTSLPANDVQDDGSSEFAGVLGQGEYHTGLAIELALPNSSPLPRVLRLC